MNKYAVIVSNERGDRPNIDVTDVSLERAVEIASGAGRVDCAPVGRAERSFVRMDGTGRVWSVVGSSKNTTAGSAL